MTKAFHSYLYVLCILIACPGFGQKTNIYFSYNDYTLLSRPKAVLGGLPKKTDILAIHLQGHCGSLGTNEYNDRLSTKRVEEVRKYMNLRAVAFRRALKSSLQISCRQRHL